MTAGAVAVIVVATLLLGSQAAAAAKLTTSRLWKAVIGGVAVLAIALAGPALWIELAPGEPAASGVLAAPGDAFALREGGPGTLRIQARRLSDAEPNKRSAFVARLAIEGSQRTQDAEVKLHLGESTFRSEDVGAVTDEYLAANVEVGALGDQVTVRLVRVAPPGLLALDVAWHPRALPLPLMLWALVGLTLVGALLEGAGRQTYQRSFFTAALSGVTGLAFILEPGLTAADGWWALALRLFYAVGIAAIAGTLLPMITGAIVPALPAKRD